MKNFRLTLVLLFLGVSLRAQDAGPAPPVSVANAATVPPGSTASIRRTPQELDQLLAPIALYPDVLIALILPAATVPTDIVLAARYLSDNPGDTSQVEHRAWDDSVKSLTHYPDVVKWMDENLQWTKQVGEAFADQPAEVMQSVQRLRAKARAAGTLVDTPQQQVLAEPQVIRIVPAQPDVVYVPYYEPEIVFVERPVYYPRPFLTFGIGVPVGSWLAFDCDWRRNVIWVGNRHRRWTGHDWRRPVVSIAPGNSFTRTPEIRQWRPPPQVARPPFSVGQRYRTEIARPVPMAVTTSRTYTHRSPGLTDRRQDSSAPPVINPLPQSFTSNPRSEYPGPRAPSAVATPQVGATSVNPPPAPTPNLQPLPQARRNGGDGPRDNDTRSRGSRGNQANNSAAPLPVVPALPMATPAPNPQTTGPMPQRSYSRAAPATAPAVVPALPMATPSPNSQPMGPTPQRSYSRAAPPPAAAPAVVPSLPMAGRSAPPATVAPAAAPAAPAPAPAAQRGDGGESRGNRSGGGGRREDNSQAR